MIRITRWSLLCLFTAGSFSTAADEPTEETLPDAEMLEFMAEFPDMDDETFELLVEHGLREKGDNEENRDEDE